MKPLLLLRFALAGFLFCAVSCGPDPAAVARTKREAYDFVTTKDLPVFILVPHTPTFSSFDPNQVSKDGDNYVVRVWADYDDAAAKHFHERYICTVNAHEPDHQWTSLGTRHDDPK